MPIIPRPLISIGKNIFARLIRMLLNYPIESPYMGFLASPKIDEITLLDRLFKCTDVDETMNYVLGQLVTPHPEEQL